MRNLAKLASSLTLAAGLALAPTAYAQQVSTDFDHNANFESYHTFSFYKVQTANPLFEQRVRDAISRDLQAKGWQMVPSGGDIAITAVGSIKDQQEYTTFYNDLGPGFGRRGWGGGGWGGWGGGFGSSTATTSAQTIPVGTLLVDLYDTRTHNLVFRGRSDDELNTKHSEKNIKSVNKSIDKMFDHFPPKASR